MEIKPRPCKRCKTEEISVERLEAIPGTILCAKCSAEVGGEWEYSVTNENTAKADSLKKNYSSVSIKKKRKSNDQLYE